MKIYKFLIILFILIIIAIAFKFSPFLSKSELGKKINEVTEINHAKEIQEVLTAFDSIHNNYVHESEAVGGAIVITYKGQIAYMKCFGVKFPYLGRAQPVRVVYTGRYCFIRFDRNIFHPALVGPGFYHTYLP